MHAEDAEQAPEREEGLTLHVSHGIAAEIISLHRDISERSRRKQEARTTSDGETVIPRWVLNGSASDVEYSYE